jgi:hypothetical protein
MKRKIPKNIQVKKYKYPKKIIDAVNICDEPYLCEWSSFPIDVHVSDTQFKNLGIMNKRLMEISNKRFIFSLLYAAIKKPIFNTTKEAFSIIANLPSQKRYKDELCLARTLLAAKTSKSFSNKGVIFIGSLLDSKEMHAWVIEDGLQPDHEDRTWINFRPLLAIIDR